MKTSRIGIVAVAIVALGGCASMHDKNAYVPNQEVDDTAYVATVERVARTRGVGVHWINVPQKRTKELQKQ